MSLRPYSTQYADKEALALAELRREKERERGKGQKTSESWKSKSSSERRGTRGSIVKNGESKEIKNDVVEEENDEESEAEAELSQHEILSHLPLSDLAVESSVLCNDTFFLSGLDQVI